MAVAKKKKWSEYMWIVSATYLILGFFNIMFAWIGLLCFFIPLILSEMSGEAKILIFLRGAANILNASFEAGEGESIQLYLDAEGVIVSTGSACASGDIKPSHVLMAKTGDAEVAHSSIRFSFGLNNTAEDVNRVMAVLPGIIDRLQKISTVKMKGR